MQSLNDTDTASLEDSLATSHKIKLTLTNNPAITILGIYQSELKTYAHTETFTRMCITVLFIIAKIVSHQDVL